MTAAAVAVYCNQSWVFVALSEDRVQNLSLHKSEIYTIHIYVNVYFFIIKATAPLMLAFKKININFLIKLKLKNSFSSL